MSSQCTVSYSVDMTTKGTPGRMVRIDDKMWAAYGELCTAEGTTRADDIRRHVHSRVEEWRTKQARKDALLRRAAKLQADSES